MEDNIIPFPIFNKRDRMELSDEEYLTPEAIQMWKHGLQGSFSDQWQAYEMMFGFMEEEVQEVIRGFLLSPSGDPLLKTKFLQKLKQVCPEKMRFSVLKKNRRKELALKEVPIEKDEWPEDLMIPLTLLEDKAYNNPSLQELASELWMFLLEKEYPFHPTIDEPLKWTAGLHSYTLKVIDEERADKSVRKLAQLYEVEESEWKKLSAMFEEFLGQA